MSQAELASEIGVSQTIIAMFENGLKVPSLNVAISLSKTLNITLDDLVK